MYSSAAPLWITLSVYMYVRSSLKVSFFFISLLFIIINYKCLDFHLSLRVRFLFLSLIFTEIGTLENIRNGSFLIGLYVRPYVCPPVCLSQRLKWPGSGRSFFMLLRRANAIKVWANAIIFRKQRNYCCCLSIFSLNNV